MEFLLAFLAYSCLFLIPIAIFLFVKDGRLSPRLPPGPIGLPFIGNLHRVGKLPYRSFWLLSEKYGPLMSIKLGCMPTIIISSSEMASEILKTHDLVFCSRPSLVAFKRYSYGGLDIAFSPYSEQWKQLRKISMLEFFSAKRVQAFQSIIEEEVNTLVQTVMKQSSSGPVNLSEMSFCLFNNITAKQVFGRRISVDGECTGSKYQGLLRETFSSLGGFPFGDFFPMMGWLDVLTGMRRRLERSFRAMDQLLEEEIEKHMHGGGNCDDLMSTLLGLQNDPTQGFSLTRDHIKAVVMNMFIAGSDTTTSILVWGMTELMRNPMVMKKAQDEVRGLIGNKGKVEESDIQRLHYLKLVVKEVLRLHPPGPLLIPRECMQHCKINGFDIPKKTRVYINAWAINRDSRHWQGAEVFMPERFKDNDIDYKGQHFQFLPFGSGRRICPGMSLSVVVLELALANLLYRFNWDLPAGMSKEDIDMEEQFDLVMHRKSNLVLVAAPIPMIA
ncbi:cytochrome P450 71A9 isoform X1 [Elaeis guineensis]|uniref:Cytochrome P450 71A9 n=1 Tax=Elaeis guineensis var. tenera TaxID=51953 RepID=A0A6I9RU08_ELAGV|nr:cytochrome P450 71A9 [Elaeis guineensis]